jgi:hypothetical protein
MEQQRCFAAGDRCGALDAGDLRSPAFMRAQLAAELRQAVSAMAMGASAFSDLRRIQRLAAELWLCAAHHEDWLQWNALDWVHRLRWNHGEGHGGAEEGEVYLKAKRRLADEMEARFRAAGEAARAIVEHELQRA